MIIAGSTTIKENCYIGSGLCVGNGVLVGFGSNVIRNISANAKVVGNPASEIINKFC